MSYRNLIQFDEIIPKTGPNFTEIDAQVDVGIVGSVKIAMRFFMIVLTK